jgi:hypothetical protein
LNRWAGFDHPFNHEGAAMLELQAPPRQLALRNVRPPPVESVDVTEPTGPFSAEEWNKLRGEDRWLATVLGVMAVSVMSLALVAYGTIAILSAYGWH